MRLKKLPCSQRGLRPESREGGVRSAKRTNTEEAMGQKFVPNGEGERLFIWPNLGPPPPFFPPFKNFRTKNPLHPSILGEKGGGAISAGAVFGHFSSKNVEKWPKSALSLYLDPFPPLVSFQHSLKETIGDRTQGRAGCAELRLRRLRCAARYPRDRNPF